MNLSPRRASLACTQVSSLIFAGCAAWSTVTAAERPGFTISVLIVNRADVSEETMAEMKSEAGYVLRRAGISVTWIDCAFSPEPEEVSSRCEAPSDVPKFPVTIIHGHFAPWYPRLGYTVMSKGSRYAAVMIDAVEELAREQQLVSKGQLLGHAVAHEIGHLLMGTTSHSPRGLMREDWKINELREMADRHLLFSKAEGERMRGRAATAHDQN